MPNKRKMVDDDDIEGYAKIDRYHPVTVNRVADKYRAILKDLGENPEREGLQKTPERVAKALHFLTHGYDLDPAEILRSATAAGLIDAERGERLISAHRLYTILMQMFRLSTEGAFDPTQMAAGVLRRIAAAADLPDFRLLESNLAETRAQVRGIFETLLGKA